MKLFIFIFIFLLNSSLVNSALVEMENEYIKIIGDVYTGRYIIKTTKGDPNLDSDQNALLLYEDYPPTSFVTIRIDNRDYKFGDSEFGGVFTTPMIKRDENIFCSFSIKNIEISQNLKFVKGPTTGNFDTVEISYTIWNKDSIEHNIGLRIMLDTYLGKEDGAPFRIPNFGDITTEKMLSGENLPEYWYSYDDLGSPTVRAQGTLIIPGEIKPDKVIFSSWERFNKYLWEFEIKEGRSFRRSVIGPPDSAVAIYFNPKKFAPNDTVVYKTYYGLYGATIYKGKVFNISLGAPSTTSGETFLLTADVQNISPYKAENATAEIFLPGGLKILGDEMPKKELASIGSKEIKKTSWNLFADGSKTGIVTLKVKVEGMVNGKLESEIAERNINITGVKKIEPVVESYLIYDFSSINKLIEEINSLLNENNRLLDNINNLLKSKGEYKSETAEQDRKSIRERITNSQFIEKKIPNAIKESVKKSEIQKKSGIQ
jgi:ElaB/YqjD/DUF883 family membrane-anchored ribosome-binding protein